MGKEEEINQLTRIYQLEAEKVVLQAFNEGYMLGMQHANKIYGDIHENKS